jgi:thiamine biosynthesis lipoprotein
VNTVAQDVDPPAIPMTSWPALGTTAVLCAPDNGAVAARFAAAREIEGMDAAASRFDPHSELSCLNRAHGRWVRISERLLEALRVAVDAARITGGAVDPTLGQSLVDLGYDRDWSDLPQVPAGRPLVDRPDLCAVRRRAPWRAIALRENPPMARVPAGVKLDLGATAKALTADRAARAAHLASGAGVLLSLGGDIATAGPPPPGGWVIRVTDDHRDGSSADGQTVTIASGGLATSSLVPRRWLHEGQATHHVLDPDDGLPVRPWWRTVSVAAASCADANIASTAALVLGRRAPAWLAAQGLPARLVAVSGAVTVQGDWPP